MPCCGATEAVWCGQGRGQTFGAQTFGPLGAELSGRDARTSGSSASRHPPPLEAPSARRQCPRGCGCRLPLRERGRGRSTRQRSGSPSFLRSFPPPAGGGRGWARFFKSRQHRQPPRAAPAPSGVRWSAAGGRATDGAPRRGAQGGCLGVGGCRGGGGAAGAPDATGGGCGRRRGKRAPYLMEVEPDRSDREAAPAGAAFRGSDAERKEVKQGNGVFNA